MFFVINKDKIYSYIVTLSVIGILFTFATVMPSQTLETAGSVAKELPIYSVKTEEKKVALTINCAW